MLLIGYVNHNDLLDSFDDGNDDLLASVVIEGEKTSNTSSAVEGNLVFKIRFEMPQLTFLARLDKVQEELLYYPVVGVGVSVSKMLKFLR